MVNCLANDRVHARNTRSINRLKVLPD